ncbi:MAG: murein biosynthesis integral membrane protein MurJ, partial [candidate division NC10 bacterium]
MTLPDPGENGGAAAAVEAGVVRAVGSIGLATLTSRILGFVRDVVVARAFGAGPVTDAFFVAFRIPNLFRRLLAEGALSTAFIPVFTDYLATRPRADFNRMLRAVAGGLLLTLCAVSAAGALLAPWLVAVMAPGFSAVPEQLRLATTLTRLMFPYLVFVGLAALAMGVLNAHRRFFTSALGPAALNVGMIAAVLFLASRLPVPVLALAVGVLVGGLGQFAIQLPEVHAAGVPLRPSAEFSHPALRRIARLLGPTVFGLAAVQLNVFVNTLLASLLPSGSISFLYYADRVVEFPLGVFGIAVASASLPLMAEQAARRDLRGLGETV